MKMVVMTNLSVDGVQCLICKETPRIEQVDPRRCTCVHIVTVVRCDEEGEHELYEADQRHRVRPSWVCE